MLDYVNQNQMSKTFKRQINTFELKYEEIAVECSASSDKSLNENPLYLISIY